MMVVGATEAWKKVFSLKTLGGGYVRHFLLLGEEGMVFVETDNVANLPPWVRGSSGDLLTDLVGAIIEEVKEAVLPKRIRQLRLAGLSVDEALQILEKNGRELGVKRLRIAMVVRFDSAVGVELDGDGTLTIFNENGRKSVFEIMPENLPVLDSFLTKTFAAKYRRRFT